MDKNIAFGSICFNGKPFVEILLCLFQSLEALEKTSQWKAIFAMKNLIKNLKYKQSLATNLVVA